MFAYVLFSVLLTFCVYKIVKGLQHFWVLRHIPSPKSCSMLGNVVNFFQSPEEMFQTFARYGREYGPIYQTFGGWITIVTLLSPEDIKMVVSGMKNLNKNFIYLGLNMWLKEGLITSTAEKWHGRRKMLNPTFQFNALKGFTTTLIEKSEELAHEIGNSLGKTIDVVPLAAKFTFLNICETACGTNIDPAQVEAHRKDIHKMDLINLHRVLRPWFHSLIFYVFSPMFYRALLTTRRLRNYTWNIIKERKRNFNPESVFAVSKGDEFEADSEYKGKRRLAMLDMLLSANLRNEIDMNGIQEEIDTFISAGYDTTTASLSFTLMALACNRDVQDKVAEELRELLPNKEDKVTYNILNHMNYLERVIKESLRLYPPVTMFGRVTSETIQTHTGYTLPVGTNLLVRTFDLHRNPEIYPEPEKFDPDRFLPEEVKKRHPFAYIPFSAGPRNCIGQKFALLELKALLSAILRRFEILPVDTPDTIQLMAGTVLYSKNGIRAKFIPRSNK